MFCKVEGGGVTAVKTGLKMLGQPVEVRTTGAGRVGAGPTGVLELAVYSLGVFAAEVLKGLDGCWPNGGDE